MQTAYFAAHEHATKLILECLERNWSEDEIRSLLGTIAILRGHHPLGAAVSWLYHTATCPICTTKFPTQGYSWFREYQIIDIGIREFNINSSQYRRWITENPLGFVLKMPTQLPAKHLIVHRSGCEALHHTSEQDRLNVEKVVCIPDKQRFWEWKSKYDLYGRDSVRECGVCTMNE